MSNSKIVYLVVSESDFEALKFLFSKLEKYCDLGDSFKDFASRIFSSVIDIIDCTDIENFVNHADTGKSL